MKKCPYCAEEVQEEAVVCRHCNRDLAKHKSFQLSSNQGGKQKNWFARHKILTGIVIVVLMIWFLASLGSNRGERLQSEAQSEITPTNVTAQQEATAPTTPEDRIKGLVTDELKGQNSKKQERLREVRITPLSEGSDLYSVRIFFNADENLTTNLKKKGIELQMAELYHQLYTSGLPIGRIVIQANTMLVDQYGNEHDTRVYETALNKADADKINWSTDRTTLQMQIIPGVWTNAYVHSVYKE